MNLKVRKGKNFGFDKKKYEDIKKKAIEKGFYSLLEVHKPSHSELFKINPKVIGKGGEKVILGAVPYLRVKNTKNTMEFNNLPKVEIRLFLSWFKREINKSCRDNLDLINLRVVKKYHNCDNNIQKWKDYKVGRLFYHLDIKNGYWQMLHRLGYISTKLYEEYLWDDNFKHLKRLCVTFLGRKSYSILYNATKDGKDFIINCDNSMYNNIYTNVRNELVNCLHIGLNEIGKDYFKFVTDGVYLHKDELVKVKTALAKANIGYKYTLCKKISHNTFIYAMNPNDVRNMFNKQK